MKAILIALGVVLVVLLISAGLGGEDANSQTDDAPKTAAEKVAESLNRVDQRIECQAKANAKTIMCLVHTSDSELRKLATGVVLQVNAMDIPLAGWKVTMVNTNDYVVTRRF